MLPQNARCNCRASHFCETPGQASILQESYILDYQLPFSFGGQNTRQKQSRERRICWGSLSQQGNGDIRNTHQQVTLQPNSGSRDLVLSYFLLVSQSTTPAPGMLLQTLKAFPRQLNKVRHTQGVILNSDKLTILTIIQLFSNQGQNQLLLIVQ